MARFQLPAISKGPRETREEERTEPPTLKSHTRSPKKGQPGQRDKRGQGKNTSHQRHATTEPGAERGRRASTRTRQQQPAAKQNEDQNHITQLQASYQHSEHAELEAPSAAGSSAPSAVAPSGSAPVSSTDRCSPLVVLREHQQQQQSCGAS
uniref:Uncharacterized protein n=1 Tax=Setaria italica TaxID=4555 RepID=K3Z0M6_SETIT